MVMPSGWDVYYIVFLSAFLALLIPASLALASFLISSKYRGRKSVLFGNSGAPSIPALKINTRFFLAINAALILLALGLALVPCVGILQSGIPRTELLRGLISIVSLACFSALGLLYSARKGDLSWLRSYREDKVEK